MVIRIHSIDCACEECKPRGRGLREVFAGVRIAINLLGGGLLILGFFAWAAMIAAVLP